MGVLVDNRGGVQVGKGVGVGAGAPGMTTAMRLITMLMTRNRLMNQKMVWLVLRFLLPRLLTTINLL
jgi:hypothetical protein